MRLRGRVTTGGAGLAAIALVVLLAASGCGYGGVASAADHPDLTNGLTQFKNNCGSCHTLQAAQTQGTVGPNLDNAFAGSVIQGYGQSTIENVVLDQIRVGTVNPILATYTSGKQFTSKKCLNPATKPSCEGPQMPANLVTGQNAIDVAAYVASVAGAGGYATPGTSGGNAAAKIFTSAGCAGCHTFGPAGSTGTIGPNLDTAPALDAKADKNMALAAFIKQSIIDPNAYLAKGYSGGIMPSTFGTSLTSTQIDALVAFILSGKQ